MDRKTARKKYAIEKLKLRSNVERALEQTDLDRELRFRVHNDRTGRKETLGTEDLPVGEVMTKESLANAMMQYGWPDETIFLIVTDKNKPSEKRQNQIVTGTYRPLSISDTALNRRFPELAEKDRKAKEEARERERQKKEAERQRAREEKARMEAEKAEQESEEEFSEDEYNEDEYDEEGEYDEYEEEGFGEGEFEREGEARNSQSRSAETVWDLDDDDVTYEEDPDDPGYIIAVKRERRKVPRYLQVAKEQERPKGIIAYLISLIEKPKNFENLKKILHQIFTGAWPLILKLWEEFQRVKFKAKAEELSLIAMREGNKDLAKEASEAAMRARGDEDKGFGFFREQLEARQQWASQEKTLGISDADYEEEEYDEYDYDEGEPEEHEEDVHEPAYMGSMKPRW